MTFGVKNFAGTQFTYPIDFIPSVTAACGFGLGPGETHILKARWPAPAVPPPGTHPCLVAALFARLDRPAAGKRVWEQNNLAQKNLTVVDLRPGDRFLLPILLANLLPIRSITTRLELIRPAMWPALEARLVERLVPVGPVSPVGDESALECGHGLNHGAPDAEDAPDAGGALGPLFGPGPRAGLPVHLGPSESRQVGLSFTVPADAAPNSSVVVDAVQRDGNRIVGGVALRIIIR